jgi:hypothetical protein
MYAEPTTGLNVMNIDKLMSVYPNPSNGLINMRLADAQVQDVTVLVYDMLGKAVHSQKLNGIIYKFKN